MNKKRTNRFVAILNIISIIAFYIFAFSASYLMSSIMTGNNAGTSIYDSIIIDTLLNKIQIILPLMHCGIGILNIICAIQNRQNKKISFWQLVFGIYSFYTVFNTIISLTDIDEEILEWVSKILLSIVPIILAIINFIKIKKNKPKVIQIISYVGVIILSILDLLGIFSTHWDIIAVVMQLIYIHFQDKYIEESKARKIVNVILYYIIQSILVVGFFLMVIIALLTTKINDEKWKSSLTDLYNSISSLQGVTTKELYIPVEKGYKYGFITEDGKEKIPCEYDRVSYFNEIEIDNNKYCVAFAKKDNKFYIISKTNNKIEIKGALEKYLITIDKHLGEQTTNMFNENGNYRLAYLQLFEFLFQVFNRGEKKLEQQLVENNNYYGTNKKIELTEKNSKYTYKNLNYSILIEPIYDGSEEENDYYDNYNDNGYYYDEEEDVYNFSSYKTKYKVTIAKNDGDIQSSVVYLPGIDEDEATLETFTNGYIEFKNEDETRVGWYNEMGNQTTIPSKYEIRDMRENKIILRVNNDNSEESYNENTKSELKFIIIDMTGKTLLETTALDMYEEMYLIKNANNKMVLVDKDLKVISNEYDKIITTMQMDISPNYSSYY